MVCTRIIFKWIILVWNGCVCKKHLSCILNVQNPRCMFTAPSVVPYDASMQCYWQCKIVASVETGGLVLVLLPIEDMVWSGVDGYNKLQTTTMQCTAHVRFRGE